MAGLGGAGRRLERVRGDEHDPGLDAKQRRLHVADRRVGVARVPVRDGCRQPVRDVGRSQDDDPMRERVFHREHPLVDVFVVGQHDHILRRCRLDRVAQRFVGGRPSHGAVERYRAELVEQLRHAGPRDDRDERSRVLAPSQRDPAHAARGLLGR